MAGLPQRGSDFNAMLRAGQLRDTPPAETTPSGGQSQDFNALLREGKLTDAPEQSYAPALMGPDRVAPPSPTVVPEDAKKSGVLGDMARSAGGIIESAGELTGIRSWRDYGEELQQRYAADINTFGDVIDDPRAAIVEGAAEAAPQLGVSMGGGAIGGAIGSLAGPGGTAIGAGIGTFGTSFLQELGTIRVDQRKEGVDDWGRAITGAAGAATLDTLAPVGRIARKAGTKIGLKFLREKATDEVREAVKDTVATGVRNYVGRRTRNLLVEGGTEGAQTGVERWAAGKPVTTPEAVDEMLVSAVKGGAGGAAIDIATSPMTERPKPDAAPGAPGTPGTPGTPPPSPRGFDPNQQTGTGTIATEGEAPSAAAGASGYDTQFGSGKYGDASFKASERTMGEVYDYGQNVLRPQTRAAGFGKAGDRVVGTSAIGKYQMVGGTMAELAEEVYGPNWRDTKFTPEVQETLAKRLFEKNKNGNLKAIWEGLPDATPGAYANMSWEQVRKIISKYEGTEGRGGFAVAEAAGAMAEPEVDLDELAKDVEAQRKAAEGEPEARPEPTVEDYREVSAPSEENPRGYDLTIPGMPDVPAVPSVSAPGTLLARYLQAQPVREQVLKDVTSNDEAYDPASMFSARLKRAGVWDDEIGITPDEQRALNNYTAIQRSRGIYPPGAPEQREQMVAEAAAVQEALPEQDTTLGVRGRDEAAPAPAAEPAAPTMPTVAERVSARVQGFLQDIRDSATSALGGSMTTWAGKGAADALQNKNEPPPGTMTRKWYGMGQSFVERETREQEREDAEIAARNAPPPSIEGVALPAGQELPEAPSARPAKGRAARAQNRAEVRARKTQATQDAITAKARREQQQAEEAAAAEAAAAQAEADRVAAEEQRKADAAAAKATKAARIVAEEQAAVDEKKARQKAAREARAQSPPTEEPAGQRKPKVDMTLEGRRKQKEREQAAAKKADANAILRLRKALGGKPLEVVGKPKYDREEGHHVVELNDGSEVYVNIDTDQFGKSNPQVYVTDPLGTERPVAERGTGSIGSTLKGVLSDGSLIRAVEDGRDRTLEAAGIEQGAPPKAAKQPPATETAAEQEEAPEAVPEAARGRGNKAAFMDAVILAEQQGLLTQQNGVALRFMAEADWNPNMWEALDAFLGDQKVQARPTMGEVEAEDLDPVIMGVLDEDDKAELAEHYNRKTWDLTAARRFQADVHKAITLGLDSVARRIKSIVQKAAAAALAAYLVFNPIYLSNTQVVSFGQPAAAAARVAVAPVPALTPHLKKVLSPNAQIVAKDLIPQLGKGQYAGKAVVLADKPAGRMYVFDGTGKLAYEGNALYGADLGDVLVAGKKITPAGTFPIEKRTGRLDYDTGVTFALRGTQDTGGVIAIHSVWTGDVTESREARLVSDTGLDNKVSFGCINTAKADFAQQILPLADQLDGGVAIVVPDAPMEMQLEAEAPPPAPIKAPPPLKAPPVRKEPALPATERARQAVAAGRARRPTGRPPPRPVSTADVESLQHLVDLETKLKSELTRRGLSDINLFITSIADLSAAFSQPDTEGAFAGLYNGIRNVILLAGDAKDPLRNLDHEIIHALRAMKAIKAGDWSKLVRLARADQTRVQRILDNYGHLSKDEQNEELVAELFADWARNPALVKRSEIATTIVGRLQAFLTSVKQAILRSDFKTAEGVLEAIDRGFIGANARRIETLGESPSSAKFIYAGVNARTADLQARDKALAEFDAGIHPHEVRKTFGWHMGADRKWRFEINDIGAALKDAFWKLEPGQIARLDEVFDHPILYAAYPEAADIIVSRNVDKSRGWYDENTHRLNINPAYDRTSQHETLLHEIQHAVQGYEDFARGTNPDDVNIFNSKVIEKLRAFYEHSASEDAASGLTLGSDPSNPSYAQRLEMLNVWSNPVDVDRFEKQKAKLRDQIQRAKEDRVSDKRAFDRKFQRQLAIDHGVRDSLRDELSNAVKARKQLEGRGRTPAYLAAGQRVAEAHRALTAWRWTERDVAHEQAVDDAHWAKIGELEEQLRALIAKHDYTTVERIFRNDAYRLAAGEVEARDVADRAFWDAEKRRVLPPGLLQYELPKHQIVLDKSGIARAKDVKFAIRRGPTGQPLPPRMQTPAAQAKQASVARAADALTFAGKSLAKQGHVWLASTKDLAKIASNVPAVQDLVDVVNRNYAESRAFLERMAEIKDEYFKLPQRLRGVGKGTVSEFLEDSTMSDKWGFIPDYQPPANATFEVKQAYADFNDAVELDQDLFDRFEKMDPRAQAVIKAVFRMGFDLRNTLRQTGVKAIDAEFNPQIEEALAANDVVEWERLEKEKARALKNHSRIYDTRDGTPYAPLMRDGNWAVVGKSEDFLVAEKLGDQALLDEMMKDPEHYRVNFVDGPAEARKLGKDYETKFGKAMNGKVEVFPRDSHHDNPLIGTSNAQLYLAFTRMQKRIDSQLDLNKDAKAAMQRMARDLYLNSATEYSALKGEMKRRKVSGKNPVTGEGIDMMKAFITRGSSMANFIGSMGNNAEVQAALERMDEQTKDMEGDEQTDARRIVAEVKMRLAYNMGRQPSRWVTKVLKGVSLWTLLSVPFYYVQNGLQTVQATIPMLASRYGYPQSWGAMMRGYRDFFAMTKDRGFTDRTVLRNVPADIAALMEYLAVTSRLDAGFSEELGKFEVNGFGILGDGLNWIDRLTRRLPQYVETMNRATTGIATYRLARKRGKSHDVAMKEAGDVIDKTQGDYSGFDAPAIFRVGGEAARIPMQFKRFQFIQGALIAREVHRAVRGKTWAEKMQGAQFLGFTFLHYGALAGLVGQPGSEFLGDVVFTLLNFLDDDDDDDWNDWKLAYRETLKKTFGTENQWLVDFLYKGAPYAAGIDTSQKLGMGNVTSLFPYLELKQIATDKDEMLKAAGKIALGPSGGILSRAVDGMDWGMTTGDWNRFAASLMPNIVTNTEKALRVKGEGVRDKTGQVVWVPPEDVGWPDMLAMIAGVTPSPLAEQGETLGAKYSAERLHKDTTTRLRARQARLVEQRKKAAAAGDQEALAEIAEKQAKLIQQWNAEQDARARDNFTRQPLSNLFSIQQDVARRQRQVYKGVPYDKASKGFVEEAVD